MKDEDSQDNVADLRTKAEESLLRESLDVKNCSKLSPEEVQRLLHELRVHQIELEIQNEELRRAQGELEKSKDRYVELYDFAPVGYLTVSDTGLILEANLTLSRVLGVERKNLIKTRFSRFVCQGDTDAYYLHLRQTFVKSEKQTAEVRLIRKDGTHFYAQLESVAVQDESGELNRCRTIISDITELRRAENALRASEERFRKVFEQGPLGVAILDLDYRWVSVNARLCEMLGYTEDELTKLTFVDITHPDDIEEDLDQSNKLLLGEIPENNLLKRYVKKNGETLWISLTGTLIRDQQGEGIYFLAMIEDITERKEAQEALRESEEQYRAVFDNAGIGIDLLDRDRQNCQGESSICRICSVMPRRNSSELTFLDITHPDDRRNLQAQTGSPHVRGD